ncbi:uncharacterized protein LOC131849056 [Achroia grisella]|uniref:uncharacterized protein LOC131849056 n=1 Tax=Achroia grisella TaxID=688607 RepID=UPI0027D2C565|nr:uncharacterized protein LOC131849056 [Achroia grisella]
MSNDDDNTCHMCTLATEMILYIFTYLPAKDLTRCRRVCVRWKQIVDSVIKHDILWRDFCKNDFNSIYKSARAKSRYGLRWQNIYRSLSLWPRLLQAKETRDEFASASCQMDEIWGFAILRDGIIGVQTFRGISYYDIDTLEPCEREFMIGDCLRYNENHHAAVVLGSHAHLLICRRIKKNPYYDASIVFNNVKTFILVDKEVYFVTMQDEIFGCDLDQNVLSSKFIKRMDESVLTFGYTDRLQVLTMQRNIYSLVNQNLVLSCTLDENCNLLHQFKVYNLMEYMDWQVFFQWMHMLKQRFPDFIINDIIVIRQYGDIYFVGTNWGVLRIYYAPYTSGQLDIFHTQPMKQYNFMERSDCPVLSLSPIRQVDVLETKDGHTVLVAMPKKIAVLNFTHSFKRNSSVAMLPYSDVQKVKLLKINDSV